METAKMPQYWQKDLENMVFIHDEILLSHKEEWNFVIHRQMDGIGEYYLMWSYTSSEGQQLCVMWIVDLKQMQQYYGTLITLVQGRHSAREGNQKLECGWCAPCTGINIENLN
jgi:hypothetical protein